MPEKVVLEKTTAKDVCKSLTHLPTFLPEEIVVSEGSVWRVVEARGGTEDKENKEKGAAARKLEGKERRAAMKKITEARNAKLKEILTEEQAKKLKELQAKAQAGRKGKKKKSEDK